MLRINKTVLGFFNFFGITCLILTKDNLLKVSNFKSIVNYVLTFLMLVIQIVQALINKMKTLNLYNAKYDRNLMAIIIGDFTSFSFIVLVFCIYFIQNFKRYQVCECFEKLRRLKITKKSKKVLKQKILINFSCLMTVFGITIYFFCSSIVKTISFATFVFILSTYAQTSGLLIYFTLKICEELMIIKLEEFYKHFEQNFKISTIVKLVEDFHEILSSFRSFQNAFGIQLTVNMAYLTNIMSIAVS